MDSIGMIGLGTLGSRIARLAVDAGMQIAVANSRGAESLEGAVAALGSLARASTVEAVATENEVIVVAIPLIAVRSLPAAAFSGRVVLDTSNYYPSWRDGFIEDLDSGAITSAELVQQWLPGARVVRGFNNISEAHVAALARTTGDADRSALPIAGDHADAKTVVGALLDRLGFDALNAGCLSESWRFDPETPASAKAYFADPEALEEGMRGVAALIAAGKSPVTQTFEDPGAPLPVSRLRELLATASRLRTQDRVAP